MTSDFKLAFSSRRAVILFSLDDYPVKTQVEFRSRKFPPYEGEQEQINPGLWGIRLAE